MNTKAKLHNEFKIIKYIMSTQKYKAIFLFTILLCMYGVFALGITQNDFITSILTPFMFHLFNIFLFSIFFLNNNNACSILKSDFSFYIMLLGNKKEYVKTTLRVSSILYSIHFIMVIMIMLSCFLLTTFSNFEVYNYGLYTISNVAYCIFYLFRYFVIGLLIILIFTIVHINISQKYVIILQVAYLFLLFYFSVYIMLQDKITLNVFKYFNIVNYSTFSLEVTSSIIMVLVLEIILCIGYFITNKIKRVVVS